MSLAASGNEVRAQTAVIFNRWCQTWRAQLLQADGMEALGCLEKSDSFPQGMGWGRALRFGSESSSSLRVVTVGAYLLGI